jgi:hypothetical protein
MLETTEVVKTFAEMAIAQIRQNIKDKGAYNTGRFSNSIDYSWDGKELIIYSSEKYITVLETGRKPGKFAPPEDIQLWVRSKLGKSDDREVKSIAYAINKKIAEKGSLLYRQGGNSGILSSVINEQYVSENLTEKLLNQLVIFASNEFLKKK